MQRSRRQPRFFAVSAVSRFMGFFTRSEGLAMMMIRLFGWPFVRPAFSGRVCARQGGRRPMSNKAELFDGMCARCHGIDRHRETRDRT